MPTSPTVQNDFATEFDTGVLKSVRLGAVPVANRNYRQTLNDDDDNNAVAVLYERRASDVHLKYALRQKGDGRITMALDFGASTPEKFHGVCQMVKDGMDAVIAKAVADNWRANSAVPTLSSFSGAVASATVSVEKEITFANIAAQGNEADSGGSVTGFVVAAVSTGTLKIGPDATSAKPFVAGTNDTIDATNKAYWTSAGGASGATNAFTVKALDNLGWLSATAVQAQVTVS